MVAYLLSGLAGLDDRFTQRWEPCSLDTFLMTVTAPGPGGVAARWRVDLRTRAVTSAAGRPAGETAGVRWEVTGPVDQWAQVVTGQLNLSVALRHRLLRYSDSGDPTPAMLNRIAMLADLLGITTWQRAPVPGPRQASDPAGPSGSRRASGPGRTGGPGQPAAPAIPPSRAAPGPRAAQSGALSRTMAAPGRPRRAAMPHGPARHGDGPGRGQIFSSGDVPATASRPARFRR